MNRLDIDKHSSSYEKVWAKIIKNTRMKANGVYIKNIEYKLKQYKSILNKLEKTSKKGSMLVEYLEDVNSSYIEVKNLLDDMDEKFLLFVVGTGNYGKSTLINALIQEDLAPIYFRPKTWKIDVYYLDEKGTGEVIIKFSDGNISKVNKKEAKEFLDKEEEKIHEGIKNFNKVKNQELKKCNSREEREEMKKKLQDEYLYKSKVVEVRWPVKNNKFLKNMMLVDTPGLTQDTLDLNNSIKDYYFKADGVIWMLDGSTISSKSNDKMIEELEEYLKDLGGINDNIIGVVNKIDKVYKDGGDKAVEKVLNDAKNFFGHRFKYIMPISAKQAFENADDENLLNLNKKIEEAFLSDSNALKLESKAKGVQKIINDSIIRNDEFVKYISEKNEEYYQRKDNIKKFEEDIKEELEKELTKLIDKYLEKVGINIETKAGQLFDIKNANESKAYAIDQIFELNKFQSQINSFLDVKKDLIDMESERIYQSSMISKYKYITNLVKDTEMSKLEITNLNLQVKQDFNIYTSLGEFKGDGLLDFLGGLVNQLYRGAFKLLKMNSVKSNLRNNIDSIAESSKNDILDLLNSNIDKIAENSKNILEKSYENILFTQSEYKKIEEYINKFNIDVVKEFEMKLEDVFY